MELRWALAFMLVIASMGGARSDGSDEKVLFEFYSESLCPYCATFLVNYLDNIFDNGLIDLIDLRMFPYGNARAGSDGKIKCQHGVDECKLNVIQTCAINLHPNVSDWYPFIFCLERLVLEVPRPLVYKTWEYCVPPSGLELEPIKTCAEGPLGIKFEKAVREKTDNLDPPHTYVPWVVVNGTPLFEEYQHYEKAICDAYKGSLPKPAVCDKLISTSSANRLEVCEKGHVDGSDVDEPLLETS